MEIFFQSLFQRGEIQRGPVKVTNGFRQPVPGQFAPLVLESTEGAGSLEGLFDKPRGVMSTRAFDEMKRPPEIVVLVDMPVFAVEGRHKLENASFDLVRSTRDQCIADVAGDTDNVVHQNHGLRKNRTVKALEDVSRPVPVPEKRGNVSVVDVAGTIRFYIDAITVDLERRSRDGRLV